MSIAVCASCPQACIAPVDLARVVEACVLRHGERVHVGPEKDRPTGARRPPEIGGDRCERGPGAHIQPEIRQLLEDRGLGARQVQPELRCTVQAAAERHHAGQQSTGLVDQILGDERHGHPRIVAARAGTATGIGEPTDDSDTGHSRIAGPIRPRRAGFRVPDAAGTPSCAALCAHDVEAGDHVARKGRARRFREARQLKQGYDDGLFAEGSGSLADVAESDSDADEDDDFDDDESDDADEAEPGLDWDPDRSV